MAEVHPDIQVLLAGLLQGGLASLAAACVDRIQSEDPQPEEDPFRERPREDADSPEWARVLRQVEDVDATITRPLKREIEMMDRIRRLAEQLDLKSVVILPPGPTGVDRREPIDGLGDDLLSLRREAAIRTFLETWLSAVDGVRRRWEERRDDG